MNDFDTVLVGGVALAIVTIILCLSVTHWKKLEAVENLISLGGNPVAVRCALDLGENSDMLCAQVQNHDHPH